MSRDEMLYLRDIAESCEKVTQFAKGLSKSELVKDQKTYDAVVRNLEIIGEAAKHISENLRKQMPYVEWRKVAGLRDMLTHVYFGIDNNILWDIIQHKVPQLTDTINEFLNKN
jgi:uncharacterized protein with HEPN domain